MKVEVTMTLTVGHSSNQYPDMYPMNTTNSFTQLDTVNPVMTQGQMDPQAFNQPNTIGQERIDPLSFYSPNIVMNAGNNPQMMNSGNAYPGLSQYSPGMMSSPQVQQQQLLQQMMRMPVIPSRMMTPSNIQAPQPGSIRYPTPFQSSTNTAMRINNRLPSPGSSSVGQNFTAAQTVNSNVNRPFLSSHRTPYSPYNMSPIPVSYQHMPSMMYNPPFYPSENYFSRYQAEHFNSNLVSPSSQNTNTIYSVASSVGSSVTMSYQQQVGFFIYILHYTYCNI